MPLIEKLKRNPYKRILVLLGITVVPYLIGYLTKYVIGLCCGFVITYLVGVEIMLGIAFLIMTVHLFKI